jgi:leucyl aminopeptidase
MEWKLTRESLAQLAADAVVVFHPEGRKASMEMAREGDGALNWRISTLVSKGEITGKLGEVTILYDEDKIPASRVIVVGLGKEEKADLLTFRDAVATAAREAKRRGVKSLGVTVPSILGGRHNTIDLVQALVEGMELGMYEPPVYRAETGIKGVECVWVADRAMSEAVFAAGIKRGQAFAHATNFARFLVNETANRLTPEKLADHALAVAERHGLKVEILDEHAIAEMKMNGLLAVSKGSEHAPRMIVLTYQGEPESREMLALVGNGVTSDSGNIMINSDGMEEMKIDIAGAAAVLGAMDAIGDLRPHVNVTAIIPSFEKLPYGQSLCSGDVIESFGGKTIEVTHTDSERRIILADVITYALRLGATKLVDIGMLAGHVAVALGHEVTGLMTNDVEWGEEVKHAARIAGERVREVPLFPEYEEYVKGETDDLINHAAEVVPAGIFLKHFAEGIPWVHLDIERTARASSEKGLFVKGPTGAGVRTLIQLALLYG